MKDINVIRGKCAFKTAKGQQLKKKRCERQQRIQLERGAELGGTNNAPVAISLEPTIGSCVFLDMLFVSHSSTN